jgi:hypothetical protein
MMGKWEPCLEAVPRSRTTCAGKEKNETKTKQKRKKKKKRTCERESEIMNMKREPSSTNTHK